MSTTMPDHPSRTFNVWAAVVEGIEDTRKMHTQTPAETAWLVHQSRKAAKRWRSYLRLVRGGGEAAARQANHMIADATRSLSFARDGTARQECLMLLEAGTQDKEARRDIVALRHSLTDHHAVVDEAALLLEFRDAMVAVGEHLEAQPTEAGLVDLRDGIQWSTLAVQKALKKAQRSRDPEKLHDWRKRVQRLKFQRRIAEPENTSDALDRLSDCLGEIHDLDVLAEFLKEFDLGHAVNRYDKVLHAAQRARTRLQAEAFGLAAEIWPTPPKAQPLG